MTRGPELETAWGSLWALPSGGRVRISAAPGGGSARFRVESSRLALPAAGSARVLPAPLPSR